DPHGGYTLHGLYRLASLAREGRWVGLRERERERDLPRAVHRHVLHHACREDVLTEAGVLELGEGALDARLQGVGGGHGRKATQESSRGATSRPDRKSTRLNSSHVAISYAVFCLKKKN